MTDYLADATAALVGYSARRLGLVLSPHAAREMVVLVLQASRTPPATALASVIGSYHPDDLEQHGQVFEEIIDELVGEQE